MSSLSAPAPPKEKIDPNSSSNSPKPDKGRRPPRGKAPNREVQISKALSKLLRHDAEKHKLKLDSEGFAELDKVLQTPPLKSLHPTLSEIHHSVTSNAKQRFALRPSPTATDPPDESNPSHFLIRANQGHSIPLSSAALLTKLTPDTVPETVVHGTYFALYPQILEAGGLRRMNRNHIHFSTGLPESTAADVISGMRNDAELLFYIDVRKSMEDGVEWWISDNGVVLTEGDGEGRVGPGYWGRVVGRRGGVGVLWEEGREVGKMPEGVRGKKVVGGKVRKDGGGGEGKGKRGRKGKKRDGAEVADNKQEEKIEEALGELEASTLDPPLVVETVTSPDEKH